MANANISYLENWMAEYKQWLIKLATLDVAFKHLVSDHWIPLQDLAISLHDSLCKTCRGDGGPVPGAEYFQPPPKLSITIPVPPPVPQPGNPTPSESFVPSLISNSSPDSVHLYYYMARFKKRQKDCKFGPVKKGQHCQPSYPPTRTSHQAMSLF